MPTYEYRCSNCEHHFETFQSITAAVLKKCPQCGKSALKRLIGTGSGIIFKGSGFYQTDYRSESYNQAAKKESETGTKKEEKSETKLQAKTETKTEAKSETKHTAAKSEKSSGSKAEK